MWGTDGDRGASCAENVKYFWTLLRAAPPDRTWRIPADLPQLERADDLALTEQAEHHGIVLVPREVWRLQHHHQLPELAHLAAIGRSRLRVDFIRVRLFKKKKNPAAY